MRRIQYFLCCFKFLCLITAGCMSGYWIYKYWKDEDISVIEYKSFKDFDEMNLPAMSICFSNPITISNRSLENDKTLTIEKYLSFLRGENDFNGRYETASFENDTINILDYLDKITLYQRLNTEQLYSVLNCSDPKSCPFVSFRNNLNTFLEPVFLKCFEMKVEKEFSKSIGFVMLGFKNIFERVVLQSRGIFALFSYPGQLLTDITPDEQLWKNASEKEFITMFKLGSIDILRRRNKRSRECLSDFMSYDDVKLKKAIQHVGCKALYHNLEYDTPICNRSEQLAKFNGRALEQIKTPPPCEENPQVSFSLIRMSVGNTYGYYPLQIGFPKKMKLITQQQAIDIHALIGNIGGYIGLFLGVFTKLESRKLSLLRFF